MDCIFCKIVEKTVPADIVFENDTVMVFNDINPRAPIHQLIIPKNHIATANDIQATDQLVIGEIFTVAAVCAKEQGFAENGYRLVMNCNQHGGQEVYHIHLHMLAGKQLSWPPGV